MERAFAGLGVVLATMAIWTGCDEPLNGYPPAVLKTAQDLKYWSSASAPNAYMMGVTPMMLTEFVLQYSDAGCPAKTSSGTVDTYQGGCTVGDITWTGKMTLDNSVPDAGTIRYEGYGFQTRQPCGGGNIVTSETFDGSFTQNDLSVGTARFKVDLVAQMQDTDGGSCDLVATSAAWDYEGTTNSATDTWSGKGRIGDSERGMVSAETTSETIDDAACSNEAASGTTTIHAGADTAVITYDGASKCDSPGAITWTLNGTSQGEVPGISCSVAPAGLPGLALLVAAAALWRMRASRRSPGR